MGTSLTQPIFLSYSRNDVDSVLALRLELEKSGFSICRDEDAVRIGDQWLTRLQAAHDFVMTLTHPNAVISATDHFL